MSHSRKLFLRPFVLCSALVFAQGDRGAITGLITDNSGAAVPNVALEAVNTATNARFETLSTSTGSYRLVGLPIGLYDVTAKASGFNAAVQRGVQIQTNQTATIDIGGRSFRVANSELERLWFGEYLLLWRPGISSVKSLMPGMRDPDVRWLRASLARIQGAPVAPMDSEFFDATLAARVRDYQRARRLPMDGMAGQATQVAMTSELDDGNMPRLALAN